MWPSTEGFLSFPFIYFFYPLEFQKWPLVCCPHGIVFLYRLGGLLVSVLDKKKKMWGSGWKLRSCHSFRSTQYEHRALSSCLQLISPKDVDANKRGAKQFWNSIKSKRIGIPKSNTKELCLYLCAPSSNLLSCISQRMQICCQIKCKNDSVPQNTCVGNLFLYLYIYLYLFLRVRDLNAS